MRQDCRSVTVQQTSAVFTGAVFLLNQLNCNSLKTVVIRYITASYTLSSIVYKIVNSIIVVIRTVIYVLKAFSKLVSTCPRRLHSACLFLQIFFLTLNSMFSKIQVSFY